MASCGIPGHDQIYYMGSTGGGLWKTTDAGISWKNVSDGFFAMGSVGAVAVASSDVNVVYVGMGEHPVRGVMTSHGDGMYKSEDAGKTWRHIGLKNSRHIAEIRVHPDNADLVFVAVQGAQHGSSADRGIYKSEDGGDTWRKVLFIDNNTGAADLSMDIHNPRILYAGMWDHRRLPWQMRSGGPGSGLYKSIDSGETWEKLEKGLPEEMGKVSIDVSPANSQVVYANIESEGEKGGVYRSNDGGKSWKQTSKNRVTVARAWYYIEIFADPVDEDMVYVLNAPMLKSIDGGKTFTSVSNPHGDQHHMWINPDNHNNIILSNDGGACITFNGGKSWSTQKNQMTVQFYRVITDERVPYYVYGGQQDNSTVAIVSRTNGGGIGWKDWYPVSGCESAFIAFDPKDPVEIFAGCYQGNISVFDHKTRESRDIVAYPTAGLGWTPSEMRYRFNWNAPIVASPFDPNIIYHAGNQVLKTTDGGLSWTEISPDLTKDDKTKQIKGGAPYTSEGAGGEVYNTISYLECSPHDRNTIYVGSDCGLVHVTHDEGVNWENITPPNIGEALINAIDVSPHDAQKVYLAVTKYKFNDMRPMIYMSSNGGKSWQKRVNGIPSDTYVRVVREDPKTAGLLYAGTENGLYVSFDGGMKWQSMQLNLPTCPITDLTFQDNDLIVATSGRSFWILDDLGALQQSKGKFAEVSLFEPKSTYDLPSASYRTGGMGKNTLPGVIIDYYLPEDLDTITLTLEIRDAKGELVRDYSNKASQKFKNFVGAPKPEMKLKAKKGINRINWDLTKEPLPVIDDVFMLGGYDGNKVSPGSYTATLKLKDQEQTVKISIVPDPRMDLDINDYVNREQFIDGIHQTFRDVSESVKTFIEIKEQLKLQQKLLESANEYEELASLGDSILNKINKWESNLIQRDQKTFQDVINFPNRLNAELVNLAGRASGHDPRLTAGMIERKDDLREEWSILREQMISIIENDISGYNNLYDSLNLPAVIVPK